MEKQELGQQELIQKEVRLRCVRCGESYPFGFLLRCPSCNGLVDPVYDLEKARLLDSSRSLERYFYLTPLQKLSSAFSIGEGNTPCIHARRLGTHIGLERLYLKDETSNVTGTTKDRMATCVISYFRETGINTFVASSTGNSSSSLAYCLHSLPDMSLHLFCAREFLPRHAYYEHPRIHMHVIDGDFVEAGEAAKQFARERDIPFEGGFFNLARREGLKLAYLEAFEQLTEEPAVVVQAVSSGMGIYGAYRGLREYQQIGRLRRTPRFVCAQQDTCSPMYRAYMAGSPVIRPEDIVHHPHGLAEAILRGDPSQSYPYLYDIIKATDGCFACASQTALRDAQQLLLETEGINACYASATALAVVQSLAKSGWIGRQEVVLVMITGGMQRPQY